MGIFDAFSAAPGQKAALDQVNALNQGKGDLEAQFSLGRDALTTNYAKALQPYTQEFSDYSKGTDSLADALGLNGPGGSARAVSAFQANPGYQFQLNQGLNAANAKAAATGMGASGNNLIDLNNYAQGQANQGWGNYINQLNPYLGARAGAAGGIAGVNTGFGNALNANYTGVGNALYGADASIGKAQAGGDMAGYNASSNLIGAGLGLANAAGNAFGGGAGKSLFGMFKPG
jgi:hypothetical protein